MFCFQFFSRLVWKRSFYAKSAYNRKPVFAFYIAFSNVHGFFLLQSDQTDQNAATL